MRTPFKLRSGNNTIFKKMGSAWKQGDDDDTVASSEPVEVEKTDTTSDNETSLITQARESKEKQDIELQKFRDKQNANKTVVPTDNLVSDPDFEEGEDIRGTGYQYTGKEDPNIVPIKEGITEEEYKDPNREFIGTEGKLKKGVTDEMLDEIKQKRLNSGEFSGKKYTDPLGTGVGYDTVQDAVETVSGRQSTQGYTDDGKLKKIVEGKGDKSQLQYKSVIKDKYNRLALDRERDKTKLKEHKGGIYIDPDTGETRYKKDAYVTKTGEGFLGLQNRKKYIDDRLVTKEYKQEIKKAKKEEKKKIRDAKKDAKNIKKYTREIESKRYKGMNTSKASQTKRNDADMARQMGYKSVSEYLIKENLV